MGLEKAKLFDILENQVDMIIDDSLETWFSMCLLF